MDVGKYLLLHRTPNEWDIILSDYNGDSANMLKNNIDMHLVGAYSTFWHLDKQYAYLSTAIFLKLATMHHPHILMNEFISTITRNKYIGPYNRLQFVGKSVKRNIILIMFTLILV